MATPTTNPPGIKNPPTLPKITVISSESPIVTIYPKPPKPPQPPQGK